MVAAGNQTLPPKSSPISLNSISTSCETNTRRFRAARASNATSRWTKLSLDFRSLRDGNSELVLFVEAYGPNMGSLRTELTKRLPHYMRPARIIDIDKFPLNKNGKIDRPALRKQLVG